MGVTFFRSFRTAEGAGMLVELRVAEQRYRAVWEVLEGASVSEVALTPRPVQVCIVANSVQLSIDGQIVRMHPIRHDRAKEHGAFATPNGRPRRRQDAPAGAGVKATPLPGRPTGRALTPTPKTGAV